MHIQDRFAGIPFHMTQLETIKKYVWEKSFPPAKRVNDTKTISATDLTNS